MAIERCDFYGPSLFVPAETTDNSLVTQPGQYFYPLPSGTQKVTFVRILFNGVWIPVPMPNTYNEFLTSDVLQPPFTSLPVSMARVYGNQLRLFPTPNAQYPIELTMMKTVGAPTDDQDNTNFWVTDGRILLINSTCAEICAEYLDISVPNSPRIATFRSNAKDAFDQLMNQVHAMTNPSIIRQYI